MFENRKKIEKIVEEKLSEVGFKKERMVNTIGYVFGFPAESNWEEWRLEDLTKLQIAAGEIKLKLEALIDHLGLEYYRREVKETNGHNKEFCEEGFRKKTYLEGGLIIDNIHDNETHLTKKNKTKKKKQRPKKKAVR